MLIRMQGWEKVVSYKNDHADSEQFEANAEWLSTKWSPLLHVFEVSA